MTTMKSPTSPKTVITLDLETTGIDWKKDKVLLNGYRINQQGPIIYASPSDCDRTLSDFLRDDNCILRGHNIKFDALFLAASGYDIRCTLEDTRVAAYTCWPTLESHGLKQLVLSKLGRYSVTSLDNILFKPLKRERDYLEAYEEQYFQIDEKFVRKDLLIEYHKEDILNVDRLRRLMYLPKWFYDVEMPLTKILFEMELYGCPMDIPYLEILRNELKSRSSQLLNELKSKKEFNPNSASQVCEALKEEGVSLEEECEKTPTGAYQVDKQFLKRLVWKGKEGAAFAQNLLDYRRLSKILGTYVEPFVSGSMSDGRLHGSINQAGSEDIYGDGKRGTNTGRLSSSNPNLQNIPARTKEGKAVRKAFIPTKGYIMFDTDLKQIEPRLIGHFSQSSVLIKAYRDKVDTHALMASLIFGRPITEYTRHDATEESKTERFIGKTSWLATAYRCGYKKLLYICEVFSESPLKLNLQKYQKLYSLLPKSSKYGDTQEKLRNEYGDQAEEVYAKWMFFKDVQDKFKKANPDIMQWSEDAIARARRNEYVETLNGRKFPIPDINSTNPKLRFAAERKAINTPIQGSGAEIMKLIVVRFGNELVRPSLGHIFSIVHDEVVGDMKTDRLDMVKDIMENTCQLRNIPIEADTKIVNNWSDK